MGNIYSKEIPGKVCGSGEIVTATNSVGALQMPYRYARGVKKNEIILLARIS